ncbi:DUF6527 family protein [Oleiagrimonas soli]
MRTGPGRLSSIRPEFVDSAPLNLSPGVLYISERFKTALHLCPCGCGEKVITPLSPARWQVSYSASVVSLYPSVGNWDYACRSHYFIRRNQIVWCDQFAPHEIARVKERDRRALDGEMAARNRIKRIASCEWMLDSLSKLREWLRSLW